MSPIRSSPEPEPSEDGLSQGTGPKSAQFRQEDQAAGGWGGAVRRDVQVARRLRLDLGQPLHLLPQEEDADQVLGRVRRHQMGERGDLGLAHRLQVVPVALPQVHQGARRGIVFRRRLLGRLTAHAISGGAAGYVGVQDAFGDLVTESTQTAGLGRPELAVSDRGDSGADVALFGSSTGNDGGTIVGAALGVLVVEAMVWRWWWSSSASSLSYVTGMCQK